jgi:hypothetical protein
VYYLTGAFVLSVAVAGGCVTKLIPAELQSPSTDSLAWVASAINHLSLARHCYAANEFLTARILNRVRGKYYEARGAHF